MRKGLFRKSLVLGIMLLFVGASVVPSTGRVEISNNGRAILYVGGSGPGNYTSIQDAIDNASDGDTVFVYDDSSPYYENVVVDKSISLVGEDKDTTIIDGGGGGNVIEVEADWVNISGFTIQNSGGGAGISTRYSYPLGTNININNNIIKNNSQGIYLSRSDDSIITNNIQVT